MLIKMISRPITRPDLTQLIRYINEERTDFENEPNFIIRYNTIGTTPKAVAQEFRRNNKFIPRRKGRRNGVMHIIMSWHKKERRLLDDSKLFSFGQKFCELMNAHDCLMFGRPHYDKENIHLHFAMSASWLNSGKSTRISRERLKEIQIELNRMQQRDFPELKHSLLYLPDLEQSQQKTITGIPLPRKMKPTDGSIRTNMRGQQSQLESVRELVLNIAKKYPQKDTFLHALNNEDHLSVYYRKGQPTGVLTSSGKKYRFKRLAISLDNLKRDVRLFELEHQHNQNREIDRSRER